MQNKTMVIKESTIAKLRSDLDHWERENKKLFQAKLFGVAHSIVQTPASLFYLAILKKFLKTADIPQCSELSSAIIMRISVMIRIKADASISHDFAMILDHYLMNQMYDFGTDIVCDPYFKNNLKEETHSGRGSGTWKVFNNDTKYPDKIREDFLERN